VRSSRHLPHRQRALIEARGEILSVPAKKGSWRNLTQSSGAKRSRPRREPDGKTIACFSDASGEYQLLLFPQDGLSEPRAIGLGSRLPSITRLVFSPDGKKILCTDKRMTRARRRSRSGSSLVVDTDTYDHPERTLDPTWSPDGRWIVLHKSRQSPARALPLTTSPARRRTR
jgi:tricorn protease